jgi:hypothetical protein
VKLAGRSPHKSLHVAGRCAFIASHFTLPQKIDAPAQAASGFDDFNLVAERLMPPLAKRCSMSRACSKISVVKSVSSPAKSREFASFWNRCHFPFLGKIRLLTI